MFKFRTVHLFAVTTIIALLVAIGIPAHWRTVTQLCSTVFWSASVLLAIRAITLQGRPRLIIVSGLTTAISYLVVVFLPLTFEVFPTTILLKQLYPEMLLVRNAGISTGRNSVAQYAVRLQEAFYFRIVGELVFATILGLLGALLAAHWTKAASHSSITNDCI